MQVLIVILLAIIAIAVAPWVIGVSAVADRPLSLAAAITLSRKASGMRRLNCGSVRLISIPVLINRTKECITVVLTAMHHGYTLVSCTTVMHKERS